jgi:hypothetical protein
MDDAWPGLQALGLQDVIGSLGCEVLQPIHLPATGTAPISDVVFFDPTDADAVCAGSIVLALGHMAATDDGAGIVDVAAARGAAAIVLRADGTPPQPVVDGARAAGLGLLAAPRDMSWGQLYSLLRSALISAGVSERTEIAGVPEGDLFALADATAAALGAAVTIEDPQWRVLAYSNLGHPTDQARRSTILGRVPPLIWQRRIEESGAGRALRLGEGIVRLDGGLARRIAASVRVGDELVGSIWAMEGDVPLDEDAERRLARIAEQATVHLIGHRASEDIRRRARGLLVRELLEGRVPRRSAGSAPTPRGPFSVLAFEPSGGVTAERPLVDPGRILSIVALYCENVHPEATCALIDGRIWAVVPMSTGDAHARLTALAREIVARIDDVTPVRLSAGIGHSVPDVADAPRSRRGAEQALLVLARQRPARGGDAARVVHIDDVRAQAVLCELIDLCTDRADLREGRLTDLLTGDPGGAEQHRQTLRAYLDCSGNVAQAAERLGLHANTLRYRIRRLVEQSGIDLDDPDERLITELQLRMTAAVGG